MHLRLPELMKVVYGRPKPILLSIFLFYILSGSLGAAPRGAGSQSDCLVEHCHTEFSRRRARDKLLQGPNVRWCHALTVWHECLYQTSRLCRGVIKFHTTKTLLMKELNQSNCKQVMDAHANNQPLDATSDASSYYAVYGDRDRADSNCAYPNYRRSGGGDASRSANPQQRFCGAFGDPHLRTFDGQQETCATKGAWPLVDNAFLVVQITNVPVVAAAGGGNATGPATGITQVTVIVKSVAGCTGEKVYEATSEELPSAFIDGTVRSGRARRPVVEISARKPGQHVELRLRHVACRLVIRKHGPYLSVAIKLPEQVIRDETVKVPPMQVCLSGCPSRERIAYKEVLASPWYFLRNWSAAPNSVNRMESERQCAAAGARDFYFDACVFDLLISGGDLNYKNAAVDAMRDIRRIYAPYTRHYEANRSTLAIYDHLAVSVPPPDLKSSAEAKLLTHWLICALIACVLLIRS